MDGEGKNVTMEDQSMGKIAIHDHDPNKKGESSKHNILLVSVADDLPNSTGWFWWSNSVGTSRFGIFVDPHHGQGPKLGWVNCVNLWKYRNQALADLGWNHGDGGSLAEAVSRMLSPGYFDCWETFASTKWNSPKTNTGYLSLEYINNIIHVS